MSLWRVYLRSLRILSAERVLTWAIVLAGIATAIIGLFEPILFGRVIDTLAHAQECWPILALWAALGVINVVISIFLAVTADRLAHRQRLSIMGSAFERAIALPLSYHAEQGSGRVVRAILTGTDQLFALWLSFLREHFPAIVGIVVLVPTAISMDWRLAMVLFGLSLVYLVGNTWILRRTQGGQIHVETYFQDVYGRVGDVIGNVTVVQSYTRLIDEAQALQQIMAQLLRAQYPVLTWWGLLNVITRVSSTLTLVCILGMGSWLVGKGQLTVGQIVAFTGFSTLLIGKLDQIASFFSRAVSQAPALNNFFALIDHDGAALDIPGARPLPQTQGKVEFQNVTHVFSSKGQGVFELNFTAPAGKTVALVGPSGAGKTTTLALLQRLFDPQSGTILLDGCDIREFTLASLRHAIATVFQDSGLFNRSIAENIRIGKPWATDAEVEEAARRAEAHDFIMAKNNGYQFVIGERGSLLSGGERQRVAIARAILKDAPILIFDEATSALDNEAEKKIKNALTDLRVGKTTFVIAHRLSTVTSADLILVFESGRIVETGTFDELKNKHGLFSRLLTAGELEQATPSKVPT